MSGSPLSRAEPTRPPSDGMQALAHLTFPDAGQIAVAVSGGGDSMALLAMLSVRPDLIAAQRLIRRLPVGEAGVSVAGTTTVSVTQPMTRLLMTIAAAYIAAPVTAMAKAAGWRRTNLAMRRTPSRRTDQGVSSTGCMAIMAVCPHPAIGGAVIGLRASYETVTT